MNASEPMEPRTSPDAETSSDRSGTRTGWVVTAAGFGINVLVGVTVVTHVTEIMHVHAGAHRAALSVAVFAGSNGLGPISGGVPADRLGRATAIQVVIGGLLAGLVGMLSAAEPAPSRGSPGFSSSDSHRSQRHSWCWSRCALGRSRSPTPSRDGNAGENRSAPPHASF